MAIIELTIDNRRTGRTTEMVDWLVAGGKGKRVLIVHSNTEAERVRKLVAEESIEDWQIIPSDRRDLLRGRKFDEVGIDNLELFLPYYGAPITKITATRFADPSPYSPHAIQYGFVVKQKNTVWREVSDE